MEQKRENVNYLHCRSIDKPVVSERKDADVNAPIMVRSRIIWNKRIPVKHSLSDILENI